jgi:hypothetical protein
MVHAVQIMVLVLQYQYVLQIFLLNALIVLAEQVLMNALYINPVVKIKSHVLMVLVL